MVMSYNICKEKESCIISYSSIDSKEIRVL